MSSKKLLVVIPDGVGLRNFIYSRFPEEVRNSGWELIFLNMTPLVLKDLGLKEIILDPKPSFKTDLLKRAKINIELDLFQRKFNDTVFEKFKFSPASVGLKNKIKNLLVDLLISIYNSEKGLTRIRAMMKESERGTTYYNYCKQILCAEKPDMVFCTSQRPVNAVSIITAAQDLEVPTSCFIFSWDNLPKATKVLETDYYFVWSDYMKDELLKYYPHITEDQVEITGTPQFEIHYDKSGIIAKNHFFKEYGLDIDKKYLCFSGDDITTSPHDELFLNDVAEAVERLNKKGTNIGIVFRRCPVDFTNRYNRILTKYKNLIVSIEPKWETRGDYWNQAIPKKEDLFLQTNIVEHTFMVINVGSSMVFDYAAKGKPCAYINYLPQIENLKKDIREVYSYTHFKSMPNKESVYWINEKTDIGKIIYSQMKYGGSTVIENSQKWFYQVNNINSSSRTIVRKIEVLLKRQHKNLSKKQD
ncbi:UDP-glycosyltransferase [Gramella lutea]|uniref:UDP-glycosyltransferase n=1 Tax=Christiangramia lutea TaxID=1607951 RepID=A0A9X1V2H2_9FLAO|nr:UDP-glycosyltransferase [Christiangramia lutea]MCH4821573.1 UDP-glycosyltransferase [Christiangramia lutea]